MILLSDADDDFSFDLHWCYWFSQLRWWRHYWYAFSCRMYWYRRPPFLSSLQLRCEREYASSVIFRWFRLFSWYFTMPSIISNIFIFFRADWCAVKYFFIFADTIFFFLISPFHGSRVNITPRDDFLIDSMWNFISSFFRFSSFDADTKLLLPADVHWWCRELHYFNIFWLIIISPWCRFDVSIDHLLDDAEAFV